MKAIKDVTAEIRANWRGLLVALTLSALCLVPFGDWCCTGQGFNVRLACLAIAILLFALAIASRLAFALLAVFLIASGLVHVHLYRHWGGGFFDSRIEAFYESPPRETFEYLQSHIDVFDVALIAAALAYLIILLRWSMRSPGFPPRLRLIAAGSLLAGIAVLWGIHFERRVNHFPAYEMVVLAAKARVRHEQLSLRNEYLNQHPLQSRNCGLRYDRIVIVLGESAISDHMSFFGYAKPTTPFAVQSKPYGFDALAPSNQTRYSLGMMLTDAAPGSFDAFYESHSLVGQLRQCGMRTLWISNQGRRGEHDSFTTSLALEADEQIFLNEMSWKDVKFDGQIVEKLDALDIYQKKPHATFIHLIGSHTRYRDRVPAGFGFQDSSDEISQYDNSILYTDHVLSELYGKFAGESLLFVYVSDHGQFVSNTLHGSGFLPGYKEEFRIPLLIWTHDDDAIAALRAAIGDAKLNLESFDDVVRYLIGESPAPHVSTRRIVSVLRPDYVRDYDALTSFREVQ